MSRSILWALMKAAPGWRTPVQFAVLVVIADSTNDAGDPKRGIPPGWAWPSKGYIASRIGCTSRYVPAVVSELQALGMLEVRKGAGPRGANLYRIVTSAVQFTPKDHATSAPEFIASTYSTSAVQFISDVEDAAARQMNCTARRDERYDCEG